MSQIAHPAHTSPISALGVDTCLCWRRLRDALLPPQKRVLQAARRRRPVILGTRAEPWETLPERRRLLSCLEGFSGLRLSLVCRNDQVLADTQILAWLDRDHAVSIEFRLEGRRLVCQGFDSPYIGRLCRASERLCAHGLETRWVIEPGAVVPGRLARVAFEHLASGLADAGVSDLLLEKGASQVWKRLIEPLRLAHGFAAAGLHR